MSQVRVNILGPLEVRVVGVLIPIPKGNNSRVVARLALTPDVYVSVETLIQAAWGDNPPASAEHQVRKMISQLRLTLPNDQDVLATSRSGYMLNAGPSGSDVAEFKSLSRELLRRDIADEDLSAAYGALSLWRGDPAEDCVPLRSQDVIKQLHQAREALLHRVAPLFERSGRGNELALVTPDGWVSAGDPRNSPSTEQDAIPSAPWVSSCFLPRNIPDFTGRSADVDAITSAAARAYAGSCIIHVHGMAGSGKSAIALNACHQLRDRYPDGQLYVNIAASSPHRDGLTASAALGVLLTQLGIRDDELPRHEHGRLSMWRSLTEKMQLLVVLDDAVDQTLVEEIIPAGRHSAVVVTSRLLMTGLPGAQFVRVALPDRELAVDMLTAFLGPRANHEPPGAAEVVAEMCGDLPLALRLASARVLSNDAAGLIDLAHQLRTYSAVGALDGPGVSVALTLRKSFMIMDNVDMSRFLRLSMLPVPEIDHTAISLACNISVAAARRVARRFHDLALLQRSSPETYRLQGLVAEVARDVAKERLPLEARREVLARAIDHYRETKTQLTVSLMASSVGREHFLYRLLTDSFTLCSELGMESRHAELCSECDELMLATLGTLEQETLLLQGIESARRSKDNYALTRLQLALAGTLWHQNRDPEGMDLCLTALATCPSDAYALRVRLILRCVAFRWSLGEFEQGLSDVSEARVIIKNAGITDRLLLSDLDINEANLLLETGSVETAKGLCDEVLRQADVLLRTRIMAATTASRIEVHYERLESALDKARFGLTIATKGSSSYGRALTLGQMADVQDALGRAAQATNARSHALELATHAGLDRVSARLSDVGGNR
ncbi:NB-ARC domain-containing protein [Rhodococcus sp. H29-C3]|uniref:AfsR/SARP family transcriptional regulator n=1 Tax=Rhodococcus sp. H29-C3 TaxID=3046307 RepID=UPI0024B8C713|nr:NB-ARC domain-containing protein [Rhodococcus sp. H29-C3]MDJ0362338.1 NB-ARC domain-containing protein [Rhodococcus sp. H29-C3]